MRELPLSHGEQKDFFGSPDRLTILENRLLAVAHQFSFHIEAWAVFSNHYHLVGHVAEKGEPVGPMIARLHSDTASEINRLDGTPGRQVWQNYWDSALTFENSYLSRPHYTHHNAVKHGYVERWQDWPFSNAAEWLDSVGRDEASRIWREFPIDDFGASWDPPDL